METNTYLLLSFVNTGNMHGHMFQWPMQEAATPGQDLEARLSLKGLTLTRICNPMTWRETSRAPNRDGVCPPKARGLMVLPGIVGTPEWNKTFGGYFDSPARTGETLSFSDWRRQELSPRAEFSRHCLLWFKSVWSILDALVCAVLLANTKINRAGYTKLFAFSFWMSLHILFSVVS